MNLAPAGRFLYGAHEKQMRDFAKVYASFWQSPDVRSLPEDSRTLALYLLTTPHGNLIGCFRLPDAYAAEDLQWPSERVAEGFRNLIESRFIARCETTKWVFIEKFLKWNKFENPNVAAAAHKAFDCVPSLSLKAALAIALLDFGLHLSEGFRKGCETVAEQYRNPEPEPSLSQSLARTRTRARKSSAGVAVATPVAATKTTWEAYATAYASRYGVEPVRNAKVNAQLKQLVSRLGESEAPGVAGFYVTNRNGLYVASKHCTDLLLRDAEKLRTEWATGNVTHIRDAREEDRISSTGEMWNRVGETLKAKGLIE